MSMINILALGLVLASSWKSILLFLHREGFITSCLDFQKSINSRENDELKPLLSEREFLEHEVHILDKKNNIFASSVSAFVEEIVEDIHNSISGNLCFFMIT